jgi:maleamate amidohydrolase
MAIWDDVLSDRDRAVFEKFSKGHDNPQGDSAALGKRAAVIVVDVNYAFVGVKKENILDSIDDYITSCGEEGWAGVESIRQLLVVAREAGVPIIYSTSVTFNYEGSGWHNRARGGRNRELLEADELEHRRLGNKIVEEIAPQPQDIVLEKKAASVFSDTPLLALLNELDIDTLIITGTSTSGCVRATVVDAACHNFFVGVVEEGCFDRFDISHKVSLMDMHAKYGKVISLAEAKEYVSTEAEPTLKVNAMTT